MTEYTTAIVAVAVVAFAVVSKRLGRSALTGTMAFTAVGLLIGPQGLDLVPTHRAAGSERGRQSRA